MTRAPWTRCVQPLRAFGFMLVAGCQPAASPTPQPASPATMEPSPLDMPTTTDERVSVDNLHYRFRASYFSNLFYTVDCLAGLIHCTKDAFEELAVTELGGLDADDRTALDAWRRIRNAYHGRIDKGEAEPSLLPLPHSHRQVERRVRLAAYTALDLAQYETNAGVLLDAVDARHARSILARFAPRFERYWQKAQPALAPMVKSFASAMHEPALRELIGRVARFYDPQLPDDLELVFDLILRPASKGSRAEQLAHVSIIEVVAKERPEDRLDVVLHELFHYFYSQVEPGKLRNMVNRFASDPERLAYVAQGALDEGLACAFGNGLVLRALNASEFERRHARPLGLYSDAIIDRMAKAALAPLEAALGSRQKLTDPAFYDLWMNVARTAFPDGAPPRAYLRPVAMAFPEELEPATAAFSAMVRGSSSASVSPLESPETLEMFERFPRWTHVWFLRPSDVRRLDRMPALMPRALSTTVQKLARPRTSFAYVHESEGEPYRLVFVAPDPKSLEAMFDQIDRIHVMRSGLLLE